MRNFKRVLLELDISLLKIYAFNSILNAFIIFLFLQLIFHLLGLSIYFSIVLAFLYLIGATLSGLNKSKIYEIESKYDNLREKLRTAKDNINRNNEVIDDLHVELIHDLRKVEESVFFNEKQAFLKSGVILFMGFLLVFSSPTDFEFQGIEDSILDFGDTVPETFGDRVIGLFQDSDAAPRAGQDVQLVDKNLYGKYSVADLGGDSVTLYITSPPQEIKVRSVDDVNPKEFNSQFPQDIFISASESFREDIPEEQQEIVKNYFELQIAQQPKSG